MSNLFSDRLAADDFEQDPSDIALQDCIGTILSRARALAEVAAAAADETYNEFSPEDMQRVIRSIALEIGDAQDVLDVWWQSKKKE